jgi:hypothetical protein
MTEKPMFSRSGTRSESGSGRSLFQTFRLTDFLSSPLAR